jgi:hypothetical protein
MKRYLICGLVLILLMITIESVEIQNEVSKRAETKVAQKKYTPCIWKICSRPLKKNSEEAMDKRKYKEFIDAVNKILHSSKTHSIAEKYRVVMESLRVKPEGILNRLNYF